MNAIAPLVLSAAVVAVAVPARGAEGEPAGAAQRDEARTEQIRITNDPMRGMRLHWLERVAKADRVEFDLYPESNLDVLKQLIAGYAETHGHWQRVTVERRDPAAFWVGQFTPVLRMEQSEFRAGEPIPLTIESHRPPGAGEQTPEHPLVPYARLSVLFLRILDEAGNEVNPFLYPVSGPDGVIRSKVIYGIEKQTIDLTSFREPYYGTEFVYPFEPGTYRVTYYMHAFLHQTMPDLFEKRRLGSRTSNTVTFTVKPADPDEAADPDALQGEAERFLDQGKPNEAVRAWKRVVLHADDQETIAEAIRHVLIIRRLVSYDDLKGTFDDKPLAERLAHLKQDEEAMKRLARHARRLSLLHLPPKEREAWLGRWLEYQRVAFLWRTRRPGPSDEIIRRMQQEEAYWNGLRFDHLFRYPQFRPFLDRAVQQPDDCPLGYLKPYLAVVDEKDPWVVRAFLGRDTRTVLMHYRHRSRTPPMALAPFLPAHFDDKHVGRWAVDAFMQAAGLDLRVDPTHESVTRPHLPYKTVRQFVDEWWQAHALDFGVTPGADDDTILRRLAALRAADEVILGRPTKADRDDQGPYVRFHARGTIHTPSPSSGPKVVMPEGAELTDEAFTEERLYILCVKRPTNGWHFTLIGPDGIWAVPREPSAEETN
ncbi:MAG: hypothetical protein R6X20_12930 [Phycisphaerae bacterium]